MRRFFYVVQKFFKSGAKKNLKKIWQFLEVYILFTTNLISFKFDMYSHLYVEHEICKFDKNPFGSSRDTRG